MDLFLRWDSKKTAFIYIIYREKDKNFLIFLLPRITVFISHSL
jgi:hypothetical protein